MSHLNALVLKAIQARNVFMEKCLREETDCYRLFHGTVEGHPGVTVDRYGSLMIIQTFRERLTRDEIQSVQDILREKFSEELSVGYRHRGKKIDENENQIWDSPLQDFHAKEFGVKFLIRAIHRGIDPWLFLDLRAGRRRLRQLVAGKSVLNLFAYTCSAGITACHAGAIHAVNVDFAESNLEVGRANASLNGFDEKQFETLHMDCLLAMRQLADLPVKSRRGFHKKTLEPRQFDVVFLDPPAWSKGSFGAVDVENDYPSLFKPASLIVKSGGHIIATNHVASVKMSDWTAALKKCSEKVGRKILNIETLGPDEDFPSFDGSPPLKIAVCSF